MYHIVHVGLNSEVLKKLDELREAYPNLYNRQDIILRLVAEAHQNLANKAPQRKLKLAA